MIARPCQSIVRRQIRAAFTFVELMVVIAVLAVLLAMLMPALASPRANTMVFQCMENQRRLIQASILYADDYRGYIVPFANAGGFWAGPTITINAGVTKARAQAAVNAGLTNANSNPLFRYAPSLSIYHCPADLRVQLPPGSGWGYDSYSKTQNVGGDPYANYWGCGATCTTLASISSPAETVCFMEDSDWEGCNSGTWVVNWAYMGSAFTWEDPVAIFHGNANTQAFADGHSVIHQWQFPSLISSGLAYAAGQPTFGVYAPAYTADYAYVRFMYRFPGWR
jgi:prepilin-type N-terminal cleavage/methylation domain-containing protein